MNKLTVFLVKVPEKKKIYLDICFSRCLCRLLIYFQKNYLEKSDPSCTIHVCLQIILITPKSWVMRIQVQLAVQKSAQEYPKMCLKRICCQLQDNEDCCPGTDSLIWWEGSYQRKYMSKQPSSNVYITIHCCI